MNLRQKRDIRRLTRQIIQIIFFLWMPALYTSAFFWCEVCDRTDQGRQADRAECISCNADRIMWIYHFIWQILLRICLCIWNLGGMECMPYPNGFRKNVKNEASVGIRRNRTETSENEIYSVISLNADLCIRIYKKVPWNQSLGSIFHVVHR